MAVILFFSSRPGEASAAASQQVEGGLNRLLAALGLHWQAGQTLVRKGGHLAEFAVLGALLAGMLRAYEKRFRACAVWGLVLGAAVALADEGLQYFVPGRSAGFGDVLLDVAGVAAGLGAALLLMHWHGRRAARGGKGKTKHTKRDAQ